MAYQKDKYLKKIKHDRFVYLSKKDFREMFENLNERFKFSIDFSEKYYFVESNDKVWITNKSVLSNDYSLLRVEAIGMVFARKIKNKGLKLTTNTVQLFGRYAQKNVFDLDEEETFKFLRGLDLTKDLDTDKGYVILRSFKGDYLGIGLYDDSSKTIKNLVPKNRRIKKL